MFTIKFRHVTLSVKDLDESIKFYREVVGLEITERFPAGPGMEIVFLADGDTAVELISGGAEASAGAVILGFESASLEDTMALLKEKGYQFKEKVISPDPKTRFFFAKDPDGYNVQFFNPK